MTDTVNEKNQEEEQDFADLLDAYSPDINKDLQVGDRVTGPVIAVGEDSVFVGIGTKVDGVVEREELLDENGELPFKEGDILDLYVVSATANEICLSRALSGAAARRSLQDAFSKGIPVQGKVRDTCKGGFTVDLSGVKAFCPISQIDLKFVEDAEKYVGQSYSFLIKQLEKDGKNVVLSRRDLLARDQEKGKKAFMEELTVGAVVEGRVTRLMPFGAFVELVPGLEGMVHISEMSWSKVADPEKIVGVDDTVRVKVIGVNKGEKSGEWKIALSMKQITEDPWAGVEALFNEGESVQGIVTRLARFGAFVEISPGIEGLVHLSEMSNRRRVVKAEEKVRPGEKVQVIVKEIDASRKRISLSIKDAEDDPWADVPQKYRVGQTLQGTLEKRESFGCFVSLEPGITGLLPKSRLQASRSSANLQRLKEGDSVQVAIVEINQHERKITLEPTELEDEREWRRFTDNSDRSLGVMREKLEQALKESK